VSFLAVGRSFFNLIAPARIAVMYDPASVLNLVGLLLLPVFAWLAWRSAGSRAVLGLGFFAFPLAVVTLRITNIFVSDTYLLLPGAGILLSLSLAGAPERLPRAAGAAALVGLSLLSWREARAWQSDERLWDRACAVEGAPGACARWAGWLCDHGRAPEALAVALDAAERAPGNPLAAQALARAASMQRGLSLADKIGLLRAHPSDDAWHAYYLGALLGSAGRLGEAEARMREALRSPERLAADLGVVAAEAQWLCERGSRSGCAQIVQEARAAPTWDEAAYSARMRRFAVGP
jgi:hypothetical protein